MIPANIDNIANRLYNRSQEKGRPDRTVRRLTDDKGGKWNVEARIKELLISEDDYPSSMEQTVKPYLERRRTELWPERVPGNRIHLMRYKADEAKAVVIISHGFTETEEKYAELIYYFLKERYTVYCPEHCGHGYSYRMSDDFSLVHVDSFSTYIQDFLYVSELAKRESEGLPLCLFAHSMGGGVAAAAAAESPGLYDKVLLHSPMIRPVTGNIPWVLTGAIVRLMCLLGKEKDYIFGSRPYEGPENFETSCSLSRARFDYYQEKRAKDRHLQTRSGSLGWLRGTVQLNRCLMKDAWRHIKAPVLLLQAELEHLVSTRQQELFVKKLRQAGRNTAELTVIPGAKHEIFNSPNSVLEGYLETVFTFFDDSSKAAG